MGRQKIDEELKRGAVAMFRTGCGYREVAETFGVTERSVRRWGRDARYADVGPAMPETPPMRPTGGGAPFVRVGSSQAGLVVRCGRLSVEMRGGTVREQLSALLGAMGEAGVL